MNIAGYIDHTLLKPDCTLAQIQTLCQEALEHSFASVCVPPYYVKEAFRLLGDSPVHVGTVVGFPMGYSSTPAKVEEIKRAIDEGAEELDVVVNLCAIKNGQWNYVKNDIDSMTRAVHMHGRIIKVIIETGLLTEDEIRQVCTICSDLGVNFVKTSSGFNGEGATPAIVSLIRNSVAPGIKIKASGGIRTRQAAEALIEAGAARIGTSAGTQLVKK